MSEESFGAIEPVRCFMDGIDWQHHLDADISGTILYPSIESLREGKTCLKDGGCGIVEMEVRLVRWVEAQDLDGALELAQQKDDEDKRNAGAGPGDARTEVVPS